jgi:hypothetical protein
MKISETGSQLNWPRGARLIVASVLALILPFMLAGFAASVTPRVYWVKGVTDGLAVLVAIYLVSRIARARTFFIVAFAYGIPFGILSLVAVIGYLVGGTPSGARYRFTVGSAVFFPVITAVGVIFARVLERRYPVNWANLDV